MVILYDPRVIVNYRDYGIMLPIPPGRGKRVLDFLGNGISALDFNGALTRLNREGNDLKLIEGKIINREDLERVHSKNYTAKLYGDGIEKALIDTYELIDADGKPRRYESEHALKPLSDMFWTLVSQAGGTYLAGLLALSGGGFCYYLGGGMHHARYDAPSGFCPINDIAIAAFRLLAEKRASLIWIIDMDAHKGDGTAEIVHFARKRGELQTPLENSAQGKIADNKPCILTLSIHMAKGWPLDDESLALAETGRAPLLPSDADIGIDSGGEGEYTRRLMDGVKKLESLSGRNPDFALVVDGADPYEHDELASASLLKLTLEQCVERDVLIYRYLQERKIPSAWIQAGGYGDRAWEPHAHFLKTISVQF
ncbi:MAG: hypothetical protein FWB83_10985 [Treponema sp.]|nr:hypothetical protein [Treponema sp.]